VSVTENNGIDGFLPFSEGFHFKLVATFNPIFSGIHRNLGMLLLPYKQQLMKMGIKSMNNQARKLVAYCGLYCGDCFFYKGEIADLAKILRKKLREAKLDKNYEEFAKFAKEFKNYPVCYEVLGAMVRMRCKACLKGDGPPFCKIRKCCQRKNLRGCCVNGAELRQTLVASLGHLPAG